MEHSSSDLSFEEVLNRVKDDERFFPPPSSRPPLGTDPAWELIEFGSNRISANGQNGQMNIAPAAESDETPLT